MSEQSEDQRIDRELHRLVSGSDPFAAAVRATRMPMLITDPRLPDNPIVFVNNAFGRLTGYSREETLGRNCRFLQGPGTNGEDVGRVRSAIARRVPVELDLLNYRKDGTTFWNRLLISPVFDGDELTYFFASQFDITPERERMSRLSADRDTLESEITRRVSDLTATEDRLRFTLEAGRLGAWSLDLASKRLVASALFKSNFGRQPADTFTYADVQASMIAEDLPRWLAAVEHAINGGGSLDIHFRIRTPEGELRWIDIRAQTRFAVDGHAIALAGVSQDITERKRAESHRDLLIKEMSHRVKNTLATVQSIVAQSVRGKNVPDEVKDNINNRLLALAGAHDVLTDQGWEAAKLVDIVRSTIRPFDGEAQRRIAAGGANIGVSSRAATAFALALHELCTNAVKYGALSVPGGGVTINWQIEGSTFELVWTEHGGPVVEPPTRRGFGSRMIEQALSASIQGKATMDYRPAGLRFTITTDVVNLTDDGADGRDY